LLEEEDGPLTMRGKTVKPNEHQTKYYKCRIGNRGGGGHTEAPTRNLPGTTPAVHGHGHLDAKRLQEQADGVQVMGRNA
jgi:hypothetical protein